MTDRIPPQDLDMEQRALGAVSPSWSPTLSSLHPDAEPNGQF
jgi:hypothetical protein